MFNSLPEHLSERVRVIDNGKHIGNSGPVVVWLKSSHRFHENPAIDIGRLIAYENGLPLLVYHGIDERYPHASLRHHNTLLDAAVDVSRLCEKNGIRHTLHVARNSHRPSVMKDFASIASMIITDLFPIPPWDKWVNSVAKIAKCPVIEVDCHCVIPMPLYGKSVDRPFKFRSATKKLRKNRMQRTWPKITVVPERYTGDLPFEPIDVETQIVDMSARFELLKECNIDPTVLPVWREKGGENFARNRWQKFLDTGLSGYARRRNNAADPNGVSRLSSAFHYGFLSPMKVAREAAAVGTKSAEKYLDELLIFREHAWHHIYSCDDPYSPANLPGWALGSWRRSEGDVRTNLIPDYKLEYGESPSDLWNDCQNSLTKNGELHNNLRMTWGKGIPLWTDSLEKSLLLSQKLNDKYALDGRDPSSIVGVQWCHGLFDRPFEPSIPVMGIVRKRDIETHKSRIDFNKYHIHANRKNCAENRLYIVNASPLNQAIISRILRDNGNDVVILSKKPVDSNVKISVLDLKILPTWIQSRFNSILNSKGKGEIVELIDELVNPITKITISEGQTFDYEDIVTILASDINAPKIGLVSEDNLGNLVLTELKDDMDDDLFAHQNNNSSVKDILSNLYSVSWETAAIAWKENSQTKHGKYSIQSTIV